MSTERSPSDLLVELAQLKLRVEEIECATECLSDDELESKAEQVVQKLEQENEIQRQVQLRICALQKRLHSLQQLHFLKYEKDVTEEELSKVWNYCNPFKDEAGYGFQEGPIAFEVECRPACEVEASIDVRVEFDILGPKKYLSKFERTFDGELFLSCLVLHPEFVDDAKRALRDVVDKIERTFYTQWGNSSPEELVSSVFLRRKEVYEKNLVFAVLKPSKEVQEIMKRARISVNFTPKLSLCGGFASSEVAQSFYDEMGIDELWTGQTLSFGYKKIASENE